MMKKIQIKTLLNTGINVTCMLTVLPGTLRDSLFWCIMTGPSSFSLTIQALHHNVSHRTNMLIIEVHAFKSSEPLLFCLSEQLACGVFLFKYLNCGMLLLLDVSPISGFGVQQELPPCTTGAFPMYNRSFPHGPQPVDDHWGVLCFSVSSTHGSSVPEDMRRHCCLPPNFSM